MKLTKRKAFNFFRSYYDVYNELSDKDKVLFMDALLDRQFLGIKPTELKGISKFAYISQTNSIDSQVKGYEDKTGIKLDSIKPVGGTVGGTVAPSVQVQEEGKEKEKGKEESFERFWNLYNKKIDKAKCFKAFEKVEAEIEVVLNSVDEYVKATPEIKYRKNPLTWLNGKCWNDELSTTNKATKKPWEINVI